MITNGGTLPLNVLIEAKDRPAARAILKRAYPLYVTLWEYK